MVRIYKTPLSYSPKNETPITKQLQDLFQALMIYGTRIEIASYYGTLGSVGLYVVPKGRIFFITHAQVIGVTTSGALDIGWLGINDNANFSAAICLTPVNGNQPFSSSADFVIPLRMVAQETIYFVMSNISGAGQNEYFFSITGYEIDVNLLPNFL